MPRWQWVVRQLTRRLWFRASLIGALGVVAAIFAAFGERYIPWQVPGKIGVDAVGSILNIIASSMLAVTTFSLSVMTSAYGAATSNVTPRATKLLIEDRVTQNVLSSFIGSFLFAIVGIIVLQTGAYGDRGRVILFIVTIGVVILIVVSLLHWIDHLTRLGRVGETTDRVERATRDAIESRLKDPCFGCLPLKDVEKEIPRDANPISADTIGYVQHVDVAALSHCAEDLDADIYVTVVPGAFIYPDTPLVRVGGSIGQGKDAEAAVEEIRDAFAIGSERSFDQDPRFGLAVMSEIASRALSPAINDTGTAIDVVGRMTRLLSQWSRGHDPEAEEEVRYPRIHFLALTADDLFEDAFMLMARDGAGLIEVQLRIQKALAALGRMGDEEFQAAARRQARLAYQRAEAAMALDADRKRLEGFLEDGKDKPDEEASAGRVD